MKNNTEKAFKHKTEANYLLSAFRNYFLLYYDLRK